jgi:DNA-binding CsgD family transcriptional regulator/tetratricopeptide (TPR) repeat protein
VTGDATQDLLEREGELGALDGAVSALLEGTGGLLLIEGQAGIGKTSLLAEARRRADEAGATVLTATGGELERDFAHGVVRQLFAPALNDAGEAEREELLGGAAALAADAIGHADGDGQSRSDPGAVLHGLYWLTSKLAERRPVLLAIDDAHWSDPSSIAYLLYLVRRLEGVPVLVVATIRTGDEAVDRDVLVEAATSPLARSMEPGELSDAAIAELARRRLGKDPAPEFVAACRESTGGVPFLVDALLLELADESIDPGADGATRARQLVPADVARATELRLARLGEGPALTARAVGVLGRLANARRLAALTGLDPAPLAEALDALAEAHLTIPGDPVRFAHPMIRTAVYEMTPAGERSAAHLGAARVLADEGQDVEEVAAHLLLTQPGSAGELEETLREAAAEAIARGVPESAVAYLRRALDGLPDAGDRALVQLELGRAEALCRDPRAIEDLREAHRLTSDPIERAGIAAEVTTIQMFTPERDQAADLARSALEEIGEVEDEIRFSLEALLAGLGFFNPPLRGDFDRLQGRLVEASSRPRGSAREAAIMLASSYAFLGNHLEEVPRLLEHGLDEGRFLDQGGPENPWMAQAVGALMFTDRLEEARRLIDRILEVAGEQGSAFGLVQGYAMRSWLLARAGELASAEADIRAGFDVIGDNELLAGIGTPIMVTYGLEAVLERSSLDDVAAIPEQLPLETLNEWSTVTGAWVQESRGKLRLARGDMAGAAADLRACGAVFDSLDFFTQRTTSWRSALALALPSDARDEALALAAEDVKRADAAGLPSIRGTARRTLGLIEGGERGIELLRESLLILKDAPTTYERARTLVELGSALRRANQRSEAREPLRGGLDLAIRCGAERLAERAEEELRSTGARPRRQLVTGVDSLTPTEGRVAAMAAQGLSNPEIAQSLFVTVNTVESHMRQIFRKLEISSRTDVAAALEGAPGASATAAS